MVFRILLCCLFSAAAGTFAQEDTVPENAPGRFLSINVTDQTDNKTKTLATIAVQTPENGEFSCISGGETRSQKLDGRFIGTRVEGSIVDQNDRNVELEITIEMASRLHANDAETEVMTSQKIALATQLEIGKEKTIRLGGKRQCRLRIE